jgi:hypothetical protein
LCTSLRVKEDKVDIFSDVKAFENSRPARGASMDQGLCSSTSSPPTHATTYMCHGHSRNFSSEHALQHFDSPAHPPLFECDDCDRSFGSQQALDQHLNSPAHALVFECDDCDSSFGSQQASTKTRKYESQELQSQGTLRAGGPS